MELTLNILLALLQMLTINVCDSLPSRGRLFMDAAEFARSRGQFDEDEVGNISDSDTALVAYALPVRCINWKKLRKTKVLSELLERDSIGRVSVIDNGILLYRHVLMSGKLNRLVTEFPLTKYSTGYEWPWVMDYENLNNDEFEYAFINSVIPISPEGHRRNALAEYKTLVRFMKLHDGWNFFVIRGVWGIWMQKDDRMLLMNALPCKRTRRGVRIKRHELPLELSAPLVSSWHGDAYMMYVNHISDKIPRRIKDDEANAVPSVPTEGVYVYENIVLSIRDGQPVFDWLYDTLGYDNFEAVFFCCNDPFFVFM